MVAVAIIVTAVLSALFCLGYIAMIVCGSLCIQGNGLLCGPGGYDGGIAMIVIGAIFLPGQLIYTIAYSCCTKK
jgi:hypothetical protein